jgi:thiol:disulfide interchange protein
MKKSVLIALFLLSFVGVFAQIERPVIWSFEQKSAKGQEVQFVFTATIDRPWHIYGMNIPTGGPVPTTIHFEKTAGVKLVGKPVSSSKLIEQYDKSFGMKLSWYEGQVILVQKAVVNDPKAFGASGYVEYMTCNDENCLPPTKEPFTFGKAPAATGVVSAKPAATQSIASLRTDTATKTSVAVAPAATDLAAATWAPVIEQLRSFGNDTNHPMEASLWWIFFTGIMGGLLALVMPCIWPIIPMTVSFFLKRAGNRRKAVRDAGLYGLSIILIYLILGLLVTAIFGASALNSLSTNAFFNLFFFALLVLFAVSFFGAFELVLPASWSSKVDAKAESASGFLSILLMAFTLALVSFSCTGPLIGWLLVDIAVKGSLLGPAVGMFGFALALAVPFMLFAIFPTWLKSLPKSGGWLNSVKVVLGFIELAFALKFLSVADLAYGWHILDREVFLSLWIVIFALLGVYLLGKLKLPHDSDLKHISIFRLFFAIVSFAFVVYMLPGLWGAPLKAISAFAPPLSTQDFKLNDKEATALFHDYDQALAAAAQSGKPVLIDFTGYGCVNCRKMEASVWNDAEVHRLLSENFILVSLFVDDKTPLKQPVDVAENGRNTLLATVGDRWSYLQRHKFGANAQPYYVVVDAAGKPLNGSFSFTEEPQKFVDFLETSLKSRK